MHARNHTKSASALSGANSPSQTSLSLSGAFAKAIARSEQSSHVDVLRDEIRGGGKANKLHKDGRQGATVTRNELPRRGHR